MIILLKIQIIHAFQYVKRVLIARAVHFIHGPPVFSILGWVMMNPDSEGDVKLEWADG